MLNMKLEHRVAVVANGNQSFSCVSNTHNPQLAQDLIRI
jgi:hypothetical protein